MDDDDSGPPAPPTDLPASGEWLGSSGSWSTHSDPGRYREGALLGEGGMGRVSLAEDRVLRREVALKRALGSPDGPEARRLRREARIIAGLDHPGIVPVHDLGEDEDGRPYYVMRLVRGRSLADAIEGSEGYADRTRLLRSFLAACEAVAFAHAAGVIHRDLKPENILVGSWGETQVMDWGLARAQDDDDWDGVLSRDFKTKTGAVLGTPAYMSPEQASGQDVGPPADVWALGAVLYEILAGRRPFRGPSQRETVAQILSGSWIDLRVAVAEVDEGLASIVDRALAPDPHDRYPDAGELAAAVAAQLDGRARAEGGRRPRRRAGLAVGLIVAALLGWALGTGSRSEPGLHDVPETRVVQDALVIQARAAGAEGDRSRAEGLAADALALGEHPGARGVLAAHGLAPLPELLTTADIPPCRRSLLDTRTGALFCAGEEALTRFDLDGAAEWTLPISASSLSLDADAEILIAWNDGAARWVLLDAATGALSPTQVAGLGHRWPRSGISRVPGRFIGLYNGRNTSFGAASRGSSSAASKREACGPRLVDWVLEEAPGVFLAACSDRSVVRVDGSSEVEVLPAIELDSLVWTGAVDPSGRWLLLGGVEGELELLDLRPARRALRVQVVPGMIHQTAIAPDAQLLAAVDHTGTAWIVPTEQPERRYRLPGEVRQLGFTQADQVAVLRAGRLERWRLPRATIPQRQALPGGVVDIAWSTHGLAAAAGGVQLFDGSGQPLASRRSEELARPTADEEGSRSPELRSLSWQPGGDVLAAGFAIGLVRLSSDGSFQREGAGFGVYSLATGHRLVFGLAGISPQVVGPDGAPVVGLGAPGWVPLTGSVSPDGSHAVLQGRQGDLLRVVDGTPPRLGQLPKPEAVIASAITNDGQTLYLSTPEGVLVRAAEGPPESARLLFPSTGARMLALSADERWLLVGHNDGLVEVRERSDGSLRLQIDAHERRVSAMALSPDGERLATGSWDRTLRLWDLRPLLEERGALVDAVRQRWAGVPSP